MVNKINLRTKLTAAACAALICACAVLSGCGENGYQISGGKNLMNNVSADAKQYNFTKETEQPEAYSKYTKNLIRFSAELLKSKSQKGENTLISPVSLYSALSVAANGTNKTTAKEFKDVIGDGVISQTNINACTSYLLQRLKAFNTEESYLKIGDSLWISDSIEVKNGFLQKNAAYFGADIYGVDFSGGNVLQDINGWISSVSDGGLKGDVKSVDDETVMYLLNTANVNAPWIVKYSENSITDGTFTKADGKKVSTGMLNSTERTVSSKNARGFVKSIADLPLQLVAFMPNEDLTLEEYTQEYLEEELQTIIDSVFTVSFAKVSFPKLTLSNDESYGETLKEMGLETAFSEKSDFSKLTGGTAYLSEVSQKVSITVDAQGLKSGKAEKEEKEKTSEADAKLDTLVFDRPFIVMVTDNESGIPVFIGAVENPQAD